MLFPYSRWHFAANGHPFGEARVCRFANGSGGGANPPPDATPPNPANPEAADPMRTIGEGMDPERGRGDPVAGEQDAAHRRVQETGMPREEETDAEGKTERQRRAEAAVEKANKMHDKMETLHGVMVAAMHDHKKHPQLEEAGAAWQTWLQCLSFVNEKMQEADLMRKTAWEISEWENGNRSPHQLYTFLEGFTEPGRDLLAQSRERSADGREAREAIYTRDNLLSSVQSGILDSGNTNYDFTDSGAQWETRTKANQLMVTGMVNGLGVRSQEGAGTIGEYLSVVLHDIEERAGIMDAAMQTKVWRNDKGEEETAESFIMRLNEALAGQYGEEETSGAGHSSLLGSFAGIKKNLGIEFYSINELIETVNKLTEAYLESHKQHSSLKTDVLAKQFGTLVSLLPWGGKDVPHNLESQLDAANDKVKDHHVEHLTKLNKSYMQLFAPHGELEHNAHDGNLARGVLEYAASRGWLYDIDLHDPGSRDANGFLVIRGEGASYSLRDLVPRDWSDAKVMDYETRLSEMQNKGKDAETEKYYKRYYTNDVAPKFVDLMVEELGNVNVWAARGIMKRALERILHGDISPFLIIRVLRQLQENPVLRRRVPKDVLDQMGALALYNSYYTTGWLKAEDQTIFEWTKTGNKDDLSFGGKFFFGTHLQMAKDEILHAASPRTKKYFTEDANGKLEFDHLLARFFSGNVVTVDGHKFSIFSEKYKDYRDKDKSGIMQYQGNVDAGKEDEDTVRENAYTSAFSESVTLPSVNAFNSYLDQSNGHFRHESRAKFYMASIIDAYEYYKEEAVTAENEVERENLLRAAETFKKSMEFNMKDWLGGMFTDSRAEPLATVGVKTRKYGHVNAIPKMVELGFVDPEWVVLEGYTRPKNKELGKRILMEALPARWRQIQQEEAQAKARTAARPPRAGQGAGEVLGNMAA